MKSAKRRPFLKLLQNRFTLHFENRTAFPEIPAQRLFRLWAWQAIKHAYRRADISLVLLDEADARACNRDYRGKDYATNVLSFPFGEGEPPFLHDPGTLRGDLVICPQVVAKEAAEQGKTLEAHFAHLTIHGILHLIGYDHIEEAEAQAMESLETKLLNQLAYPNPYQTENH